MYNFDEFIERRGTATKKWDNYQSQDIVPLWIADMDFGCLPEVSEAIKKRADHGVFGYTDPSKEVYQAIINWEYRHHHIRIEQEEIVLTTGVIYALYRLIEMLIKTDEKIIIHSPAYPAFTKTTAALNRTMVFNPLNFDGQHWTMNFDLLDKQLKEDPSIKMLILCSPHNPTGRSWTKNELERLCNICCSHDVWIVSDEIHSGLTFKPNQHCSILDVDESYHDHLILLTSPTKAFNLAGMKISYVITKNKELRERFSIYAKPSGLRSINIFGYCALVAAYENGDKWLEECCNYIEKNMDYLITYLKEHLPEAKCLKAEATYFAWIDLSALKLPKDYSEKLKIEGQVELQDGAPFGEGFDKWQRINLACPQSTLSEGLKRMCIYLNKISK